MKKLIFFLPILIFFGLSEAIGQNSVNVDSIVVIKGKIVDIANGEPIPALIEHGDKIIRTTDGKFEDKFIIGSSVKDKSTGKLLKFVLHDDYAYLKFSCDDYLTVLYKIIGNDTDVLIELQALQKISIGGIGSPLDKYNMDELQKTGQLTIDKSLKYLIPSFMSTHHPISDATAHFDPADLRNLGPSRTLFLINGKRKNASALVYVNDTPAKGEVGVDMKSIPYFMLKNVEVLRDGASAKFGSDAIAGVVNFNLRDKEDVGKVFADIYSGINAKGDGFSSGFDFFSGMKLGEKGFFNISNSFYFQDDSFKSGFTNNERDYRYDKESQADQKWKDWIKNNPTLGLNFGQPKHSMYNVYFNTETFLNNNESVKFYSFGGISFRQGTSLAIYRAPYVVEDTYNIFHQPNESYNGFQPNFIANVRDQYFTFGSTNQGEKWYYDLSFSFGQNAVDYSVENSFNPALGINNPRTFRPGGYKFSTGIVDFTLNNKTKIGLITFGSQFRAENYISKVGDIASYKGEGVISFPGIKPEDVVDANRYNFGSYVDISSIENKIIMASITGRIENYSDYGLNLSGKAEVFKEINENLVIRGSFSTCFRAPALHQRYFSATQTISLVNQGTFNNESSVVRALDIDELGPERSTNISIGLSFSPIEKIKAEINMFSIDLKDRILYSSSISTKDASSDIGKILKDYNISSMKFFVNSVNTINRGIDFSLKCDPIPTGKYRTNLLTLNYGFTINMPESGGIDSVFDSKDIEIFDRREASRLLFSRPNQKHILLIDYKTSWFSASIRNTLFGAVRSDYYKPGIAESMLSKYDQKFSSKLVTDFSISTISKKKINLHLYVNNIFNVFPQEIDAKELNVPYSDTTPYSEINLGGRFKYLRDVGQFEYNGLNVNLKISYEIKSGK